MVFCVTTPTNTLLTRADSLGVEPMMSGDDEVKFEEEVDTEDKLEPLPSDISPM